MCVLRPPLCIFVMRTLLCCCCCGGGAAAAAVLYGCGCRCGYGCGLLTLSLTCRCRCFVLVVVVDFSLSLLSLLLSSPSPPLLCSPEGHMCRGGMEATLAPQQCPPGTWAPAGWDNCMQCKQVHRRCVPRVCACAPACSCEGPPGGGSSARCGCVRLAPACPACDGCPSAGRALAGGGVRVGEAWCCVVYQ
jgi:hypothetical protein